MSLKGIASDPEAVESTAGSRLGTARAGHREKYSQQGRINDLTERSFMFLQTTACIVQHRFSC